MVRTISKLLQLEGLRAMLACKNVEIGPDLPVNLLPGYPVGLSHVGYEFLQVPVFVDGMVRSEPALCVNYYSSLGAG